MKRFLLYSLGLGLVAIISSCGGDDPLPTPLPSFEVSTDLEIFEIAQPIEFKNGSTNASSYTWDFGDGGTSTEVNPEYTYAERGDYVVTLTAISDDEQMENAEINISVAQRELTGFSVLSISFDNLDANGNSEGPWDTDGTGPDIVFFLAPDADPTGDLVVSTFGAAVADVTEPFEPFGFSLNDPLPLTNEPWTVALLDDDGTSEDPDLMIQATGFNPILNSNTQIIVDDRIGRITVEGGGFEIFLDFQF